MKKIYAVWCKVNLKSKPDWLDDFRKKYNYLYDSHITLKQPCYIDDSDLPDIKSIVSKILGSFNFEYHKIDVLFEKIDEDKEDKSIMILADKNETLMDLQYKIRTSLKDYSNYCKTEHEQYETNFKPHLTIAMDLGDRFDEAVSDIEKDTKCIGEITEIILSCVKEDTIEESKILKNLTVYKL